MPMEITFMDMEDEYKKYVILRSLQYIHSNPLRFSISSLDLPNFPPQKSWEGALAKYTPDAQTSIKQNTESLLTIIHTLCSSWHTQLLYLAFSVYSNPWSAHLLECRSGHSGSGGCHWLRGPLGILPWESNMTVLGRVDAPGHVVLAPVVSPSQSFLWPCFPWGGPFSRSLLSFDFSWWKCSSCSFSSSCLLPWWTSHCPCPWPCCPYSSSSSPGWEQAWACPWGQLSLQ